MGTRSIKIIEKLLHLKIRRFLFIFLSISSLVGVYAQTLPTGFSFIGITDEVENVSCFTFVTDNIILLAKQNGEIYLIENDVISEEPIVRIPTITAASGGDRGLVGINIDPDYPNSPYLYVTYTIEAATHNRVSRFKFINNTVDLSSEEVLLNLSPINAKWHVGGAIAFDDRGYLFTTTGDNSSPENAQNMNVTHGKLIRINKDGTVPASNPFYGNGGVQELFWATGLRNPYTMSIHQGTNTIFVNDVGKNEWEEINDASDPGRNFGWPYEDGYNKDLGSLYDNPTYAYRHAEEVTDSTGIAITGGTFYDPLIVQYPTKYVDKYFFQDFGKQWINSIEAELGEGDGHDHIHDLKDTRETFGVNLPKGSIYLSTSPNGFLYFFSRTDNTLYKIVFYDSQEPLILVHPKNTTTMVGERTRFNITAVGAEPLNFRWFRNGNLIASAPNASSYSFSDTQVGRAGTYHVEVYNQFGSVISNEFVLDVIPFNEAPTISFTSPLDSTLYQAGQEVFYKASALDPEEGILSADRFEWFLDFYHDDHIHDGPAFAKGVTEGTFIIPDVGETSSNVWYKIRVRVKDDIGQIALGQKRLFPLTTDISFRTEPPNLSIGIDGPSYQTPLTLNFVEHLKLPVSNPGSQIIDGDSGIYRLSHWSSSVENSFYTIPEEDSELVAYFVRCTLPDSIDQFTYSVSGSDVILQWNLNSSVCTEGFFIENHTTSELYQIDSAYDRMLYEFQLPETLSENYPYEISIRSYNENGESSIKTVTVLFSKEELTDGNDIEFYPNPAHDQVTINRIQSGIEYDIELFNSKGQLIKADIFWTVEQNQINVDTSNLSTGLYFLLLSSAENTKSFKILIN